MDSTTRQDSDTAQLMEQILYEVKRVVVGRTHRLSLEPDVLSVAADWMDHQRALWERFFDVVDQYLNEKESQRA